MHSIVHFSHLVSSVENTINFVATFEVLLRILKFLNHRNGLLHVLVV